MAEVDPIIDPLPYLRPFADRTFRRDVRLRVDMFILFEGNSERHLAAGPVEALAEFAGDQANEIAVHPTTLRRLMAETRGASGRAAA